MTFTGKTAPRKRNKSGRGRKRFKKNSTANSFSLLNNNSLFIFPSMFLFIPFLISPLLPSPILPPSPPLIFFFSSLGSSAVPPSIPFFNPFYDARP